MVWSVIAFLIMAGAVIWAITVLLGGLRKLFQIHTHHIDARQVKLEKNEFYGGIDKLPGRATIDHEEL